MLEQRLPQNSTLIYAGGILDPTSAKGLSKMVIEKCIFELQSRNLELPTLSLDQIQHLVEAIKKKKAEVNQPSTIH